jgi:histidinol-phosphate/aromatic aminotransferase/cobyric acid decarboxylase-like protein
LETVEGPRGFPLGQWVDSHRAVRHNLARSGMVGTLESVPRLLIDPPPAEPEQVRALLAGSHGVHRNEVFLTHGAHEANFLALVFLATRARGNSRRLTVRIDRPEYPQITDAVAAAGGRVVSGTQRADVWALSNPNNPTGRWRPPHGIRKGLDDSEVILVDEAYREFTDVSSAAGAPEENLWVTGTFTKVYGADEIRVGWSIPPSSARAAYARFHAVAADRIAERSIRAALAILSAREEVLQEVRSKFGRNVRAFQTAVRGAEAPSGPVWFDRGEGKLPGDRVQAAALRRSILVCSGTFFGDPTGVRICLTRPSFPGDLSQYLKVRNVEF